MSNMKSEYDCPVVDGMLMSDALTYTTSSTLSVTQIPIPIAIRDDQLLVRVKAVSINPIDAFFLRMSSYFSCSKTKVVGGDYAGTIVKAGNKTGFETGVSVYGYRLAPFSIDGTFSQYILVTPKKDILCESIPEGMTFENAAATACVAATGYGIVKFGAHKGDSTRLNENVEDALIGKKVFIIGAGTSVGSFAVQFAKHYMKADQVVVTCSERSQKRLTDSGADVTVDYRKGDSQNINEILKYVEANGKFDIIIECVGNTSYLDSLNYILKDPKTENGAYCTVYGINAMNLFTCSIWSLVLPSFDSIKRSLKYSVGVSRFPNHVFRLKYDPTAAPAMNKMWEAKKLHTPIDSILNGWENYNAALQKVGTSKASGKVVCTL